MRLALYCFLSCFIGIPSLTEATNLEHFTLQPMSTTTSVSPSFLNAQPYVEFANVVAAIMGEKGSQWSRDWQPELPLVWQTPATASGTIVRQIHTGYLRMDIAGKVATQRANHHQALGWKLTLMTDSSTEDIPAWILLQADGCYGNDAANCAFDPLPSLDKKNIHHYLVCAAAPDYDGGTLSYVLQSEHHEDVLMTISNDVVNEGVSHTLTFSRRHTDMPCGPHVEEGSQFLPDDEEYMENSPHVIASYAAIAKHTFHNVIWRPHTDTRHCQIDLYVAADGTFATAWGQREGDNAALCASGIDALRIAHYPSNPSGKLVHLKTIISR